MMMMTDLVEENDFSKKKKRVLTKPGELDNIPIINMTKNREKPKIATKSKSVEMQKKERYVSPVNQRKMERVTDASINIKKKPTVYIKQNKQVDMVLPELSTDDGPLYLNETNVNNNQGSDVSLNESVSSSSRIERKPSNESAVSNIDRKNSLQSSYSPLERTPSEVSKQTDGLSTKHSTIGNDIERNSEEDIESLAEVNFNTLDQIPKLETVVKMDQIPVAMHDMVTKGTDGNCVFQPIKVLHSLYERDMLSTNEKEFLAMVVDVERILGRLQDEWLRRRESWNGLGFVPFRENQLDQSTAYPQSVLSADIWMKEQLRENINMDVFHALPRYRPLSIAEERNFEFLIMKSTVEVLRTLLVDLRKHLNTSITNMDFIVSQQGSSSIDLTFLHTPNNDMLLGPDGLAYLSVEEGGETSKKYWMIRCQNREEKEISRQYYGTYYDDSNNWFLIEDWIKEWISAFPDILENQNDSITVFRTWKDIQKSSYYQVAIRQNVGVKSKLKRRLGKSFRIK